LQVTEVPQPDTPFVLRHRDRAKWMSRRSELTVPQLRQPTQAIAREQGATTNARTQRVEVQRIRVAPQVRERNRRA
jgi:hypothetical protein